MGDGQDVEPGRARGLGVELPLAGNDAEIAGLKDDVDRSALGRGLPYQWTAETTDIERLRLVPGDVGGGPPGALKPCLDIEEREAARNVSARLGVKRTRVGKLTRREAVHLLGKKIAPIPQAIAGREVVG